MAVKIRLQRHGKKNFAFFHIVVADTRAPRDGRYIEQIGSYNPNTNPATIILNSERALAWLNVGAEPSLVARRILSYEGVLLRKHLQGGVAKGALTQEQADAKFAAWKAQKDAKVAAKKEGLSKNAAAAANIANRVLGYVNAPSLIQRVVARCIDCSTDVAAYDRNRTDLYEGLTKLGYECTKPEGAFYLFVKSPIDDDVEFCNIAKKYNILMVPGKSFACSGYVRLAYCVSHDTIINSLPAFAKLMDEIKSMQNDK